MVEDKGGQLEESERGSGGVCERRKIAEAKAVVLKLEREVRKRSCLCWRGSEEGRAEPKAGSREERRRGREGFDGDRERKERLSSLES